MQSYTGITITNTSALKILEKLESLDKIGIIQNIENYPNIKFNEVKFATPSSCITEFEFDSFNLIDHTSELKCYEFNIKCPYLDLNCYMPGFRNIHIEDISFNYFCFHGEKQKNVKKIYSIPAFFEENYLKEFEVDNDKCEGKYRGSSLSYYLIDEKVWILPSFIYGNDSASFEYFKQIAGLEQNLLTDWHVSFKSIENISFIKRIVYKKTAGIDKILEALSESSMILINNTFTDLSVENISFQKPQRITQMYLEFKFSNFALTGKKTESSMSQSLTDNCLINKSDIKPFEYYILTLDSQFTTLSVKQHCLEIFTCETQTETGVISPLFIFSPNIQLINYERLRLYISKLRFIQVSSIRQIFVLPEHFQNYKSFKIDTIESIGSYSGDDFWLEIIEDQFWLLPITSFPHNQWYKKIQNIIKGRDNNYNRMNKLRQRLYPR